MEDVSPYASPTIPDPLRPEPAGVGVWRDGDCIVLHPAAELPRLCIATGRPARFGQFLDIYCSQSFRLDTRKLTVCIPLSDHVYRACRRRRWAAIGCAALLIALTLLAVVFSEQVGWRPAYVLAIATGVGGTIFMFVYSQYSQFLHCVGTLGEYVVLRGADERYLRHLPVWSQIP
jgi:hypothetical protein